MSTSRKQVRFKLRRWIAFTVVALLALRAALPSGLMVDLVAASQGKFAITICSGTAFRTVLIDAAGKTQEVPQEKASDACVFAASQAPAIFTRGLNLHQWQMQSESSQPVSVSGKYAPAASAFRSRAPPSIS